MPSYSSILELGYLNGFCGAGKTFAISHFANNLANRGIKVLLVQPTTKLAHETINTTFPECNVTAKYTAINSITNPWAVTDTIDAHLKTCAPGGEILVVTHSAFFGLPHFHNPGQWYVIIDEIPAVERSFDLNIPDSHTLLTKHLEITDKSDLRYWQVGAKNRHFLRAMAKNRHQDQVYDLFRDFSDAVVSPQWDVYVLAESYARLTAGSDVDGVQRKLCGSALMLPAVFALFKKVLIAGACFEESIMFKLWSNMLSPTLKVEFADMSEKFKLLYTSHDNGNLLDIFYAVDVPWSKNLRHKSVTLKDGTEAMVFDAVIERAREMIGTEKVAEFYNADITGTMFQDSVCLPNVSHGLNTYQHIDHAVLMSALNPPTAHFAFLEKYASISPDEVQTAMYRQATYQAANRTSIRDQQNKKRKKWFVADRKTAEWLQGMYAGASIHNLGLFASTANISAKAGRPKVHATQADKAKAYRTRKEHKNRILVERDLRVDLVNGTGKRLSVHTERQALELAESMTEMTNKKHSNFAVADFQGTFFESAGAKVGDAGEGSFNEFVKLLRDLSATTFESKDISPAWSPSHYVPYNGTETKRGYSNIAYARNIALDFDGGTLTPDQFAAFFPSWRMVIHSSWSSSPNKLKWRVIVETDYAMDIEGYKIIAKEIIKRVNEHGYYSDDELKENPKRPTYRTYNGSHGFDRTKLNPACILFVPSTGANPEHVFFTDYNGTNRGPLEVYEVLAQADIPDQIETPAPILEKPDYKPLPLNMKSSLAALAERLRAASVGDFSRNKQRKIDAAMDVFVQHDCTGYRDKGIWVTVVQLRNAGCDASEAISIMDDAVRGSRSKDKRSDRDKAKRAIKKLL
jgi:hypothetical protein